MAVQIECPRYDKRVWGKPWIAMIDVWEAGSKPKLSFGKYLPDKAGTGDLHLVGDDGMVFMYGQVNYRDRQLSTKRYGVFVGEHEYRELSSGREAQQLWKEWDDRMLRAHEERIQSARNQTIKPTLDIDLDDLDDLLKE